MVNRTNQKPDAVVRRLYARGNWKLRSVAHFGGDETGIADMCLLQDPGGNPFIPGASIAGAGRSFLAKQLLTWAGYSDPKGIDKEPPELKQLFGGADKNDTMSALIVADGIYASKKIITSIRDGVRIDAKSGFAVDKAKFDVEVVERGAEFTLEFVCILREGDDQDKYEQLFLALLHAFQQGDLQLGARTRRGYGWGKVKFWDIRDLKLDNPHHVMAWLSGDVWNSNHGMSKLTPRPLPTDKRRSFRIEADFELRTSLLIRSASEDPNKKDEVPDTTHLLSNEKPVIPGTSFAGAFRHRAALIANALGWKKKNEDIDAVCDMFGPVHKQDEKRQETQQTDLWASRVRIEERLVKRVELHWQDRVAIDRFTGGSLQNALFNEKPIYPLSLKEMGKKQDRPNIRLRLMLEEPEKAEIGLLLLTLRDFWYGHVALGGETSNGRGTLRGIKAQLKFKYSNSPVPKVWKLSYKDKHMTIEKDDEGSSNPVLRKRKAILIPLQDHDDQRRMKRGTEMANKTPIELNKSWVCEHLCDVTKEKMAWVLLQEPGFIGFGVVQSKNIWWPPYKQSGWEPDWGLASDLRLFGEKGEWHVWRDWDGKHYARLLEFQNIKDALTEYHFLWGTKTVETDTLLWIRLVEDRGAEIWLPLKDLQDDDLPLRLKLKQIVDYDQESHLAGITDAALVALVNKEKEVLQPSLSSCA